MADGEHEDREPDDDADALHEIGHDVGEQPARDRINDDERGGRRDRDVDSDVGRDADDLAERADLRRRPEHRRGHHQQHRESLDALRVALAEHVAEGRVLLPPQRRGDEDAEHDEAEHVAERIGRAAREPVRVDPARRADDRLGAEPGRKDRECRERYAQSAACQEIVALARDATRHEHAEHKLDDEIAADADQDRLHGTMARFSVCSSRGRENAMSTVRCRSFYVSLSRICVAALGLLTAFASFAAIELPTDKAALIALGEKHRTAWDLYKDFESQAKGGQRLNPARLPDWTGIYSRSGILFNWDQDQGRNRMPTAKLTPE